LNRGQPTTNFVVSDRVLYLAGLPVPSLDVGGQEDLVEAVPLNVARIVIRGLLASMSGEQDDYLVLRTG
jgi:nitrous oxidase accessory protein NosD